MEAGVGDRLVRQGATVTRRHHHQGLGPLGSAVVEGGADEGARAGVAEQGDAVFECAEPGEDADVVEFNWLRPGAAIVCGTRHIHRVPLFASGGIPGGSQEPDNGTVGHEFEIAVAESAALVGELVAVGLVFQMRMSLECFSIVF